jgi:hypothetical protein
MTLTRMIELDEDALICDLAETYHIFDYKSLPPKTVATLAAGLRDESRIKLRAAGVPVALETIILAAIADRIDSLRYGFFKDVERGKPFVRLLLGDNEEKAMSFGTIDDFKKAYAKAIGDNNV